MSRQPIFAFACVVGLVAASAVAVWSLTRGPAGSARPSENQLAGALDGGGAGGVRQPVPATAPAAIAGSASPLVLVPLFDTNAGLEQAKPIALRFRAERAAPGGPTTGLELSLTAVRMPDRLEVRLPVREIGHGEYEASLLAHEPGQYPLRVTARGGAARTSVPVILRVVGAAEETAPALVADHNRSRGFVSRARQGESSGAGRRGR